jgi:hypothetical protein
MEIGALIGKPLCWTQQDDEITAFRQQMTRSVQFHMLSENNDFKNDVMKN